MLAFYFVQPYDSKKRIKKPSDLFRLPWQDDEIKRHFTPEAIAIRKELFAKWDKKPPNAGK